MQLKSHNILFKFVILSAAALFFFSCATVPQKAELETNMQLLPIEADIIIAADIKNNLELIYPLSSLLTAEPENEEFEKLISKTDTIWTGIDINNKKSSVDAKISVIAKGDYPKSLISFGMNTSKEWQKKIYKFDNLSNKEIKYWQNIAGNSQLAIPQSDMMLLSTGQLEDILTLWVEKSKHPVSKDWLYYESTSDLTIMTRNLKPEDYAVLIPELKKIPITSIILSLERINDFYEISGKFYMESNSAAFLFSTILKTMVLIAKNSDGEKMFPDRTGISIKNDGNTVNLKGMKLSVKDTVSIGAKWLNSNKKVDDFTSKTKFLE